MWLTSVNIYLLVITWLYWVSVNLHFDHQYNVGSICTQVHTRPICSHLTKIQQYALLQPPKELILSCSISIMSIFFPNSQLSYPNMFSKHNQSFVNPKDDCGVQWLYSTGLISLSLVFVLPYLYFSYYCFMFCCFCEIPRGVAFQLFLDRE